MTAGVGAAGSWLLRGSGWGSQAFPAPRWPLAGPFLLLLREKFRRLFLARWHGPEDWGAL